MALSLPHISGSAGLQPASVVGSIPCAPVSLSENAKDTPCAADVAAVPRALAGGQAPALHFIFRLGNHTHYTMEFYSWSRASEFPRQLRMRKTHHRGPAVGTRARKVAALQRAQQRLDLLMRKRVTGLYCSVACNYPSEPLQGDRRDSRGYPFVRSPSLQIAPSHDLSPREKREPPAIAMRRCQMAPV